jgi:hypothetical protein
MPSSSPKSAMDAATRATCGLLIDRWRCGQVVVVLADLSLFVGAELHWLGPRWPRASFHKDAHGPWRRIRPEQARSRTKRLIEQNVNTFWAKVEKAHMLKHRIVNPIYTQLAYKYHFHPDPIHTASQTTGVAGFQHRTQVWNSSSDLVCVIVYISIFTENPVWLHFSEQLQVLDFAFPRTCVTSRNRRGRSC